ncbi:DUF1672 family protein [Listeria seeligeri]|uniref:DUF1672 family protein n=1 Tax=Listeria seeligeri TaxID=1640 RepID=UPI002B25FCF7|nr:DUF1672 family protein [Listeria seeligeri]
MFAEELAGKYNLEGYTEEALIKASPKGYQGKYYFITVGYDDYLSAYNAYLDNNQVSAEELRALFKKDDATSKNITIVKNFFSNEDKLPKQNVVDSLAEEFKEELDLPKGEYPINLFKNFIVNRVGLPDGENVDVEGITK